MTKRPGDTTPEPEGGRAAERLRMFLDARRGREVPDTDKGPRKAGKRTRKKGGQGRAKQDRGKT